MARPKKRYSFEEAENIRTYFNEIMEKYEFEDLLNDSDYDYRNEAKEAYKNISKHEYCNAFLSGDNNPYIFKGIDNDELTDWVYKWLSESGRKRVNSNLRQNKFRKSKDMKTLKIPHELSINISYEAREQGKTIDVFLSDLLEEVKEKRIEKLF